MEQKNLFLAISLSILVFITWNYLFVPVNQEPSDTTPETKEVKEQPKPANDIVSTSDLSIPEQSDVDIKETQIKTPLYNVTVSNKGAVFTSFKLANYKETNDKESDQKEIIHPSVSAGEYSLSFLKNAVPGLKDAVYTVSETSDVLTVDSSTKDIIYSWVSDSGVYIEKKFSFNPDSYLIDCTVTIKNGSQHVIDDKLLMSMTNKLSDQGQFAFEGPSIYLDGVYEEIKPSDIEDKNNYQGNIGWAAIHDRYFMIGIIPEEKEDNTVLLSYDENDHVIGTQLSQKTGSIIPGSQKQFSYHLISAPKRLSILKQVGYDIDKVVDFGMFDIIAKPCLLLMDYIYTNLIQNYGVAIIILTIIFKIIVWPLGNKSYKSMNEMKKLQPLVAELREKYKNDRQKMNEEMMGLYKTYKVNPLSGCLPMVVQMPIFFAFYRMLYSAIELRHAPFFGWITDLSAPDRLFSFNFTIPFFEPPTGIPVLTLLMGASMFLQQKMSPPAGDPTQAKMMMMMPVFMTFIFMNFSSGLVLYWFVNNVISIAQQYYVMKKNA